MYHKNLRWAEKKAIPGGKYKYVTRYKLQHKDQIVYCAKYPKLGFYYHSEDEKDAALVMDRFLISRGEQPINIFKSKS